MLLEYNYDKGNKVLEMFKNSELAFLNISQGKEVEGKPVFVMEYALINDYPEPKQNLIRKALAESLPERLQLTDILNQFVEHQSLNSVTKFSLRFNAVNVRKCEISYSSSFANKQSSVNLCDELVSCLEKYDYIVTQMGIAGQEVSGVYRREGTGRNKKYIPLTIQDVGNILRHSLEG